MAWKDIEQQYKQFLLEPFYTSGFGRKNEGPDETADLRGFELTEFQKYHFSALPFHNSSSKVYKTVIHLLE